MNRVQGIQVNWTHRCAVQQQTLIDITKWPPALRKYDALSAKILACIQY